MSDIDATPPPSKPSRWDRPKPPHDWRWIVGGIGRVLIALGLLMFGFVAYQLWGTGIQTAQAQRSLSNDFDRRIEAIGASTSTTAATTTTTTTATPATSTSVLPTTTVPPTTTLPAAQPVPAIGEAVARLEIPRIDLNRIVVEGASTEELKKGPAHFPETPLPGQLGNAAIAGHRTTYLHPFYDIDKLQPGDEITVTTLNGRYVYAVTGTDIVSPDDYDAVIPTTDPSKATLTLVSCTPKYSAKNRIVVRAELLADRSDPLTVAAPQQGTESTLPDETTPETTPETAPPATTAPATSTTTVAPASTVPVAVTVPGNVVASEAFSGGWFEDSGGLIQALLWGALLCLIGYGVYVLSRAVRRYWVGLLAGCIPFLIVLYFFYENVNRLLPANL